MKCCSRYSLGVIIGSIYILGSMIGFIVMSLFLFEIHNDESVKNKTRPDASSTVITIMTVCLTIALISAVLIVGIVKKFHNLMLPWLLLYIIGFILTCLMFVFGFEGAALGNAATLEFIMLIVVGVIVIAIEVIIFFFMVDLYRRIRRKNANPQRPILGQSCHYTVVSNKS